MNAKLLISALCLAVNLIGYAADNKIGQERYQKHCHVCHSEQMSPAMKSPTVHQVDKWDPYVKSAILLASDNKTQNCSSLTEKTDDSKTLTIENKQINQLSAQQKACYLLPLAKKGVINGSAVMPPMGTCMDCSDEQLQQAIVYMIVQ